MKNFFGYHKAHEHGPFGGAEFFTNKELPLSPGGNFLYVVSAHRTRPGEPVDDRFEGKFSIEAMSKNGTGWFLEKRWRLLLKPAAALSPGRSLDDVAGFDRQWFHNKFTSGQGVREIPEDAEHLVELFEDIWEAMRFARDSLPRWMARAVGEVSAPG